MSAKPVVVNEHDRELESWPADDGGVSWKTLISSDLTQSSALTLGVTRVSPGAPIRPHRHEQPEVYFVLEGAGVVTIDGSRHPVGPGSGVFIAGNAVHSVECSGEADLRLAYVFAADAFADVQYVFGDPVSQGSTRGHSG
jgi:quercetin dioxygenase-like cupin family protein